MTIRAPILLLGAGGHARACIDVIEQQGVFEVQGLVGLPDELNTRVLGYTVIASDAKLSELLPRYACALVSTGQIITPEHRIRLFCMVEASGRVAPPIVSPRAYVSSHATLGGGTIVMHGAVVNAGAVVGRNCIINSQSLVEHDAVIADHCHIATAAAVNSAVRVGRGSFIGSGTTVRQGVNIGEQCVIGMGQRVLTDCKAGTRMPPPKVVE
jgi:sugar O-acyltransferase (sialic acid O-acetyltransferase NeuD family)